MKTLPPRAAALLVLAVAIVWGFAPKSFAADPSPVAAASHSPAAMAPMATPTPPPNALPPNPAIDSRVKDYLGKRFMIADPNHLELGPVVPTAMAAVFSRSLRVSNDKGQSVNAIIYTNASEDQMILGQAQMYDLTRDPWEKVDVKLMHLEDRPVLGAPDAPLTVIEFADFECPFCARAFSTLETMVHTTHKDKIKVIYKNYPLNSHPWAVKAALGAECARLQNPDAFWEFARDFYTNQGSISVKNIDEHINLTAKRLSLDMPTLDACMAGKAAQDRVNQDSRDGIAVGVSSTPTLLVNGVRVVGLPEEKAFEWVVNRQLDDLGKGKEMLRR